MNKRYLHHAWTRIRPIKTIYLLVAFLISVAICVVALRNNYVTMTRLRTNVYQADKNDANVVGSLKTLRSYVGSHMNTSLATNDGVYPPIQLKYTYSRLEQAEQDRVNSINSQVYTDAQHTCEAEYPGSFSGGPRVPCIEQYVQTHGTSAHAIPDAMYKFDFASPRWSPDFAGWMLVASALLFALTVLRFLAGMWLKRVTH